MADFGNEKIYCSIIIPAFNEADFISACLEALLNQRDFAGRVEIIVVPNGCKDDTANIARKFCGTMAARRWLFKVEELTHGSKPGALNYGDSLASSPNRIYLDADVTCGPDLLKKLVVALSVDDPVFATGRLKLSPSSSMITRMYGNFWCMLPFYRSGAVGAGCYAVNGAGRRRWKDFPDVKAEDLYVRLLFSERERVQVDSVYLWPLSEGFSALVRVRRRQDAAVRDVFRKYPELSKNGASRHSKLYSFFLAMARNPLAGTIYLLVSIAVRMQHSSGLWERGR